MATFGISAFATERRRFTRWPLPSAPPSSPRSAPAPRRAPARHPAPDRAASAASPAAPAGRSARLVPESAARRRDEQARPRPAIDEPQPQPGPPLPRRRRDPPPAERLPGRRRRDRQPEPVPRPDQRPGVVRADDHRRLRPDHRRGVQARAGLREHLRPDRVREPRPEPGAGDLPAPGRASARRRPRGPPPSPPARRRRSPPPSAPRGPAGCRASASCRPHVERPDQPLAVPHRLALHDEGLAGDDDPVARPRVRHLGDAEVEPRRLRPEPPAAELGDRVGPPGDDADGDRLPVRRLLGRVAPEVRIGEQPVDEAGEGGHRSEGAVEPHPADDLVGAGADGEHRDADERVARGDVGHPLGACCPSRPWRRRSRPGSRPWRDR